LWYKGLYRNSDGGIIMIKKPRGMRWLDVALIVILLLTVTHILVFYVSSLIWGIPETVAVKYAIYLVIGSFSGLAVYQNQIRDLLLRLQRGF